MLLSVACISLGITLRSEVKEAMQDRLILDPVTLIRMLPRPRVFDPDIECHFDCAILDKGVLLLAYFSEERYVLSWEDSSRRIGNLEAGNLFSVFEQFYVGLKSRTWYRPEVLDFNSEIKTSCLAGGLRADLLLSFFVMANIDDFYSIYADIWSVGGIVSISGHLQLTTRNGGVHKNQYGRYLGPEKLLPILGAGLIICSLYLVFKVLRYVYLDRGFNDNLAVTAFLLCLIQFLWGGWLLLESFSFAWH
jgi:hypothetical protein